MMPYFFTNLLVSRKAGQLGFLIFSMVVIVAQTSCAGLNNCNGHGVCTINSRCECFEGWGSKSDLTTYRAPDCSARVCPADLSWGDVTKRDGSAHNRAECSDRGICDRVTGKCKCSSGFEGAACQRLKCPNNCSGHGSCVPMQRLASKLNAFPLTDRIMTYESSNSSAAWDSLKIAGCLCESSWAVGLKVNETQQAEWFGPDCSQRHCPSADDPRTLLDETDCSSANNTATPGEVGNRCHVDCAHQGHCDHHSGTCHCFPGQYGSDCSLQLEVPVSLYYSPGGVYSAADPAALIGDEEQGWEDFADTLTTN